MSRFETFIWHFSRFETFLKVAFDVRSAAWLAARWTDGIEKAEKGGKMLYDICYNFSTISEVTFGTFPASRPF